MHARELAADLGLDRHHGEGFDTADGLNLQRHRLLLDVRHATGTGCLRALPDFGRPSTSAFLEQAPP